RHQRPFARRAHSSRPDTPRRVTRPDRRNAGTRHWARHPPFVSPPVAPRRPGHLSAPARARPRRDRRGLRLSAWVAARRRVSPLVIDRPPRQQSKRSGHRPHVVLMWTASTSGRRWLDVNKNPSFPSSPIAPPRALLAGAHGDAFTRRRRNPHDQNDALARTKRPVRPCLHPGATWPSQRAVGPRHLSRSPRRP